VAVVGSLLLVAGGATPAVAGNAPTVKLSHSRVWPGINLPKVSTTFAGWTFTPKSADSVSAQFTVPQLTCTDPKTISGVMPMVALLALNNQAAPTAGLEMECRDGKQAMKAVALVGGAGKANGKVSVDDVIKLTAVSDNSGVMATVQDMNPGHPFTLTESGQIAGLHGAEIIDNSIIGGKQLPVANFGTIQFTMGTVNGKALGAIEARTRYNMETDATPPVEQIDTGTILPPKEGNSFFTTFQHS
jgi:hypothetical protein